MDCIQTENKAVDLFGVGKHGFAAGNPGAGLLATFVSPAWTNGVQEEILNVIRAGGLVPDGANLAQMLAAIQTLIGNSAVKTGDIVLGSGTSVRAGTVTANGALLSRAAYPALFAFATAEGLVTEVAWAAGAQGRYSVGDGATTFRIPDYRGTFLRALDDGAGVDTARAIGTRQTSQNLAHSHGITVDAVGSHAHGGATTGADGAHSHTTTLQAYWANANAGNAGWSGDDANGSAGVVANPTNVAGAHQHTISADGAHAHTASAASDGGAEARPINTAIRVCIKY